MNEHLVVRYVSGTYGGYACHNANKINLSGVRVRSLWDVIARLRLFTSSKLNLTGWHIEQEATILATGMHLSHHSAATNSETYDLRREQFEWKLHHLVVVVPLCSNEGNSGVYVFLVHPLRR